MEMTKYQAMQHIKQLVQNGKYDYYGLRADNYDYAIDDICHNSHQLYQDPWYDDEYELVYPEGIGPYSGYYDAGELNGTCAVEINEDNIEEALNLISAYCGDLYLIAGNSCEYGVDDGEIIIRNAVVLDKLSAEEATQIA